MTNLFLHIGLPKTGTTAVQNYFYQNQNILEDYGILYPKTGRITTKKYGPNHQELIALLFEKDPSKWDDFFNRLDIEKNRIPNCKNIFLSHEGMTNHFYDFSEFFCNSLKVLSKRYQLNIILGIRKLDDFFFSYYKQNIINPPINKELGFGSSLTPVEFFELPRIQMILRYDLILKKIQLACPSANAYIIDNNDYRIINKITSLIGVKYKAYNHKMNQSMCDSKIEEIRSKNVQLAKETSSVRADFIDSVRLHSKEKTYFSLRDNSVLLEKLKIFSSQLQFNKDVVILK